MCGPKFCSYKNSQDVAAAWDKYMEEQAKEQGRDSVNAAEITEQAIRERQVDRKARLAATKA